MNLAEVALQRRKEELKELLKKEQQQEALQVLGEGLQSVQPYLRKAYLRMQLRNGSLIPGLLKNYSIDYLVDYLGEIFEPPASPEEAKIQMLADMLIPLLYPDKRIDLIIFMALPQIKKAYNALRKQGGGWSAQSNPERRRKAVVEWYRRNHAQLSYLKETYLEDPALYNEGGGQERRNFIARLVIRIVKDETKKELKFQEVDAHIKNLKKLIREPLRLEDL